MQGAAADLRRQQTALERQQQAAAQQLAALEKQQQAAAQQLEGRLDEQASQLHSALSAALEQRSQVRVGGAALGGAVPGCRRPVLGAGGLRQCLDAGGLCLVQGAVSGWRGIAWWCLRAGCLCFRGLVVQGACVAGESRRRR